MIDTIFEDAFSFNTEIRPYFQEISLPLEKHFGITLLLYRRLYPNKKLLHIVNHLDWMKSSFENEFFISDSFCERVKYLQREKTSYYLWPNKPAKYDELYCGLYDSDIWNGVTVYKKYDDCLENFAFVSLNKKDTEARNIYLFEKDILERFILYFKDKIFPLINAVESQILIPCDFNFSFAPVKDERRSRFFDDISTNNFYIRTHGADVKLTERQESCLSLFAHGKKMKEIGNILNVSEKTVEFYLRHIMKKTSCTTKSNLINCYNDGF